MGNLIKNEFIKILKKKSTLIILIIFLLYVILTNFLVKYMSKFNEYNYLTDEEYVNSVKEQIKSVNPKEDPDLYINLKSTIDFYELYKQYDKDSWQAFIIERDFMKYIDNVNIYKYGKALDKQGIEGNPEEEYKIQLEKLNKNDWKLYVNDEIKIIDDELNVLKSEYNEIKNNDGVEAITEQGLKDSISVAERKRELLQYRLDNDIAYGRNYINDAITMLETTINLDYDYNKKELSYSDKLASQTQIGEKEKAKYIIEHKQDINNNSNLRAILMDLYSGYSIFIIVFIVMIAGVIVSFEFEKGTIKILLVKPYKRWKILLAKYIVSLIMMLVFLGITVVAEILVGGIILGFDSLSTPVVVYNFNTNSLESYNIFKYLLIETVAKLPMFVLLTTLAFTISTLFINSAIAIIIPILGNIAGGIINLYASTYSIKQLKFFPTLNWDLTEFLFGKLPSYEYTNLKFAILMNVMYLVIMLAISFMSFKKRQIKNI